MITFQNLMSFAGVAFLMALSPGPNLLYLVSRSICQGRSAGFASLAGVCAGMFCYMLAAALGLSALFVAVPIAYDFVRLAGAAYLLWLAFRAFHNKSPLLKMSNLAYESNAKLFSRGLFTCLLNPKIVVTYGALLPQFIEPALGTVLTQTLTLGLVQIVAAASAHSILILSASSVVSLLAGRQSFANFQRYLLGTVLALLSLRLATERSTIVRAH